MAAANTTIRLTSTMRPTTPSLGGAYLPEGLTDHRFCGIWGVWTTLLVHDIPDRQDPDPHIGSRQWLSLIQIKRPQGRLRSPLPSNRDRCPVKECCPMSEISAYSAQESLRDGNRVEIRALRPEDQADMLAALEHTSPDSLQRRFFVMKRHFSEKERAFFMNIDFENHVALVALAEDAGDKIIVGGSRYVVFESGRAEVALIVIDAWQGRGLGSILVRHLVKLARDAGLKELTAEVLPENRAMLKIFGNLGFKRAARSDPHTVHLALDLA